MSARVTIVGGGIVGLSTAHQLLKQRPNLEVIVLEKEATVAAHQTGHNSGVIHSGLYYAPNSRKALLATRGRRDLLEFCAEHNVQFEVCGKLVVAADESEIPQLRVLHERGAANGLRGLRYLSAAEATEFEPHVRCAAALLVPETGIVDFAEVARALARAIKHAGGRVVTGAKVLRITPRSRGWVITSTAGDFETDYLVTCAGLHADRVARAAGSRNKIRIVPFRGDYFTISESASRLVRNLIYPVPDPLFPFLGVHATRSIHGHKHVGPSAALALAREGYGRGAFNGRDAVSALLFPGLLRFMMSHPRLVKDGVALAVSRSAFARRVQRFLPAFTMDDLQSRESGVRAQAMTPDGKLVGDFMLDEEKGAVHVLNAPSPAATAGLAIGDVIAGRVMKAMIAA
jgi:(S)-2-hydroxyglutarate dehydrogenase